MVKKHVKNYHKGLGIYLGDTILCEVCGVVAVDIHHVEFGSHRRNNELSNLIALCRVCHNKAHGIGGRISAETLFTIIKQRDERISI